MSELRDASTTLNEVCQLIDEGHELDSEMIDDFKNKDADIVESVEGRKHFYAEIESRKMLAAAQVKRWQKEVKKHENLQSFLRNDTKDIVVSNPGLNYRDKSGKKLMVLRNPSPTLVLTGEWEGSDYAKIVNTVELDKTKLKEDLIAGSTCDFAKIEYGTHLRGLK